MQRQRRKGTWAALAWGLAVFLVLQLGLAVGIETCWPILRDPDYVQKATRLRKRLSGPNRPVAVVMFGSSRTAYGFNGTLIENDLNQDRTRPVLVFNFGLWGGGPGSSLINLNRLLAEGVKPDLVLIEVLPAFFRERTGQLSDLGRLKADRVSLHELDLLDRCGYRVGELQREWWPNWPVPCYSHRFAILNAIVPTFLVPVLRADWSRNPDSSCFVPQMTAAPVEAGLRHAHREYSGLLGHFRVGGPCLQAMRRILETCQREQIRAALVLMPEGPIFRSWYPPATMRELHDYLESVRAEFGVPIINAREWVEEEGFSDSHHLTAKGAARFSHRLGREAIELLLQNQPLPRTIDHAP